MTLSQIAHVAGDLGRDRVFVVYRDNPVVTALSISQGVQLWQRPLDGLPKNGVPDQSRVRVSLDSGRVFVVETSDDEPVDTLFATATLEGVTSTTDPYAVSFGAELPHTVTWSQAAPGASATMHVLLLNSEAGIGDMSAGDSFGVTGEVTLFDFTGAGINCFVHPGVFYSDEGTLSFDPLDSLQVGEGFVGITAVEQAINLSYTLNSTDVSNLTTSWNAKTSPLYVGCVVYISGPNDDSAANIRVDTLTYTAV